MTTKQTVIQALATAVHNWTRTRATKRADPEINRKADKLIGTLMQMMPQGGYIKGCVQLDFQASSPFPMRVLVFHVEAIHIDGQLTVHKVKVFSQFNGIRVIVTGPDKDMVKSYLAYRFMQDLQQEAPEIDWDSL